MNIMGTGAQKGCFPSLKISSHYEGAPCFRVLKTWGRTELASSLLRQLEIYPHSTCVTGLSEVKARFCSAALPRSG